MHRYKDRLVSSAISATVWQALFSNTAQSGLNLQGRICRMMFSALVQGYLKPGMAVPSSRDLADQLGVGRNTVTIAYQQRLLLKLKLKLLPKLLHLHHK